MLVLVVVLGAGRWRWLVGALASASTTRTDPVLSILRPEPLALYAEKPASWRTDSTNVLDRYILAKLALTRDEMLDDIMIYWLTGTGASS